MTNPAKTRLRLVIILGVVAVALCGLWYLVKTRPRLAPSKAGQTFAHLLAQGETAEALEHVAAPKFLADKSPSERDSLIVELLAPEISPEGMEVLARDGQFGPLKEVFPEEAEGWAESFAVNTDDCVAFRMERQGIRAELVLLNSGEQYQILRCNNVRQMAGEISQP